MLYEIKVNLFEKSVAKVNVDGIDIFGKELAVKRIIESDDPDNTIYLTGFTPICASGLGFAGKLNVYGISLLGKNLQGSRSGGLFSPYLTRLGIIGINIYGKSSEKLTLFIDNLGNPKLLSLNDYGKNIIGTSELSKLLYEKHGKYLALAITDPSSVNFSYNAIICNTQIGKIPNRAAGRSTTAFGQNGLVGIAVKQPEKSMHPINFDRSNISKYLKVITKNKKNINIAGSYSADNPILGGTYGSAAKGRFDNGQGLTNLFRSANVPEKFYNSLLPDTIINNQIKLSEKSNIKIPKHSCLPGCPNKCVRSLLVSDGNENYKLLKAGEWETYQGIINLGLFDNVAVQSSKILMHANEYGYDQIEALVTLASLALITELKQDTGVRYGDINSVMSALNQAEAGKTDLGKMIQKGAAFIENYYGIEPHFTVGGHGLSFHNPRSMLQTGVGLSWSYGRHGEVCAGPGRLNFLGEPYDPADHSLAPKIHVKNTIHGMILYGAVDDNGMCFFIGPTIDTLIDIGMILEAMDIKTDVKDILQNSAKTIKNIYDFNKKRNIEIKPLPKHFYEKKTYGNAQGQNQAVCFNVDFDTVKNYGYEVLTNVATAKESIPDNIIEASKKRWEK